jgi:hypothetical protein
MPEDLPHLVHRRIELNEDALILGQAAHNPLSAG